jgi:hypothetical protein
MITWGRWVDRRRFVVWLSPFTLAWLPVCLCGCAEELGPERLPVTRVTGRVTEGGQPLHGGWIEFFPMDGARGNLRSGRLRDDGSFDVDRVAVGLNAIRLVHTSIKHPRVARIFGAYATTPIRRKLPERPAEPMAIELVEEAQRLQSTSRSESRGAGDP